MNSIVVSFGGLNVASLSCFGGRIDTPAFDRLAAESVAFDLCFVECPDRALTRRAWWTGRYQLPPSAESQAGTGVRQPCLIEALRAAGVRTVLIRDEPERSAFPRDDVAAFDQVIDLGRMDADPAQQVLDVAKRWLAETATQHQSCLLFVDCRGAHGPSLQAAADEKSHAAIVSQLDEQLGDFLDFLMTDSAWDGSLLIVTSDCGIDSNPAHVPPGRLDTFGEAAAHVPLLVRLPGAHDPSSRSAALVQSIDLIPTVCDGMGVPVPPHVDGRSLLPIVRLERRSVREFALMGIAGREWSIRTPDWQFVLPLSATEADAAAEGHLFIKPEDRWNRSNVAKQFPDVVERLACTLGSIISSCG